MENDDILAVALANRAFIYRYLWRAFADEPDGDYLDIVTSDQAQEEFALFAGENSELCRIQSSIASYAASELDALTALRVEYTKLFVGPGALPAPPWESVYCCGEDLLFQESTLEVRNDYRASGYEAVGYPHEADDHLATEFGFMAALSSDAASAFDDGDVDRVEVILSRQLMFLSKHLNVWLPKMKERLDGADTKIGPFYRAFISLACGVCAKDVGAIGELMGM